MTREEVKQAIKDKTWLVYSSRSPTKPFLARANYVEISTSVYITSIEGATWYAVMGYLRIATPNDMLKYGE